MHYLGSVFGDSLIGKELDPSLYQAWTCAILTCGACQSVICIVIILVLKTLWTKACRM